MIDFLRIDYYFKGKDKPNMVDFKLFSEDFVRGWRWYSVAVEEPIRIGVNDRLGILRVRANFMYFIQGHNFSFNAYNFIYAVEFISGKLGVNLWEGIVEELESCLIMEVKEDPQHYITNHQPPKGYILGRDYKTSRYFNKGNGGKNADVVLKLYDVGHNIKEKSRERRDILGQAQQDGWNPQRNYIKFEIHYNKPHKYLNNGVEVKLKEIFTDNIQSKLWDDLIGYYRQIKRDKELIIPTEKGDICTSTILAIYGVEKAVNGGVPYDKIQKEIYSRIGTIRVFDKTDKDNRKRGVKKVLSRLDKGAVDRWNLTDKIIEAIELDKRVALYM